MQSILKKEIISGMRNRRLPNLSVLLYLLLAAALEMHERLTKIPSKQNRYSGITMHDRSVYTKRFYWCD